MSVAKRQPALRGKLLLDEPMSRHTSWRLGGPADRYYVPADLRDLQQFLATLDDDTELLWVGLAVICWSVTVAFVARSLHR